ncbi:MAG TPA: ABC transporter substrate-binding protein [Candidatus Obscuribacterales bacterium]
MKTAVLGITLIALAGTMYGCTPRASSEGDIAVKQAVQQDDKESRQEAKAGSNATSGKATGDLKYTQLASITGPTDDSHLIAGDSSTESDDVWQTPAHPSEESTKEFARELKEDAERLAQESARNQEALAKAIHRAPNPGPFKLVEVKAKGQDGAEEVVECWQARGKPGEFGGTLTVSTFGSGPKTFNYWAHQDAESAGIGYLMFERFLDLDPWTGETYPRLAKSIKVSADHKEYIITLRKGLKWSDGSPLTADDVVYTFDTIVRRGFGNSSTRDTLSVFGKFPTVRKIDDLTVSFQTSHPFAPFLNCLLNAPIAPKHVLEKITNRPMEEFHSFWDVNCDPSTLVVSGPFKLGRYVPGQRIEMVRNRNYAMVDKLGRRLPYLDKFVVAIVPDQNTQILKFYGNELDVLDIKSVRGFDAALMKQKEESGNFKMYNLGPDDGTVFLMFNMNRRENPKGNKNDPKKRYYVDPVKQKWFNDPHFRQAVSHAINRKRIVDNVLRGVGMSLYTSESPASLYFNRNLKPFPQDLNYAAELLARGGFVKKGGKLYDRDGNAVEFTLNTNAGNTARDATCIMIVNDLKKLGMKVNYQPIDFNILVDKTHTSLDWEAIVMGLTGDKVEPYNGANVWKSDGRIHMFDQRLPDSNGRTTVSDARDWEKEIDRNLDLAATTFDEKLRHKYFDRYQQIAYEQQPFIYLYCILDIASARNKLGNYAPTPLGITYQPKGSFHNLEELYIIAARH